MSRQKPNYLGRPLHEQDPGGFGWCDLYAIRFWMKVEVGGEDECWPWLGYRTSGGYGQMTIAGEMAPAHQWAWRFTHGDIPAGLFVCHDCDFPTCCNPAHLFVAPCWVNNLDARLKRRSLTLTNNGDGERLDLTWAAA